jgi:hypothetical protein
MDNDWEELDTSWLKEEESYLNYYPEDVETIKLTHLYLNKDFEIDKINEEHILLKTPNILSGQELLERSQQNSKYKVETILKYNLSIEPKDVNIFLKNNKLNADSLVVIDNPTNISNLTITFNKTIHMFQSLNNIIIIYSLVRHKMTRRHKLSLLNKTIKKQLRGN